MDTLISVYPIHPLYKEVCQRHAKELALMYLKAGAVATPESEYQAITEVRVAADEFAHKYSVPETCRTQQQVVGPNNVKVNTTIFRPIGSQDKVLPVILYW